MKRTDILEKREQILQWISEGKTKQFICTELKCKNSTLNNYLIQMGIEYKGRPGINEKGSCNYKTAEEYIKSTCVKSSILRQKLIRDGIKENRCEICGALEWQGKILPLELHHKDGNHFNNELSNLAILCPNCHAIQEGNSGANVGKYTNG